MSDFNERLRAARRMRGFPSAIAAAKAFGWSLSTYCSKEGGQRPPTGDDVQRYAGTWDVSPGWLGTGLAETADDRAAEGFLKAAKPRLRIGPDADVRQAAANLQAVRSFRGFVSARGAAATYGWASTAVSNHESARVGITPRMAEIYGHAYGAPRAWFDPATATADVDLTTLLCGSARPKHLVDDFSARIDVADFARRPAVDWIPVYAPAAFKARFDQGCDPSEADSPPHDFMPLAHRYVSEVLDVPAADVVGVDMPPGAEGGHPRTRLLLDASRADAATGPRLEVDENGRAFVMQSVGSDPRLSGCIPRAGASRFRIIAALQLL